MGFSEAEAQQKVTIHPTTSRRSMRIWRKGDELMLETYNEWGVITATIFMAKKDLADALMILGVKIP